MMWWWDGGWGWGMWLAMSIMMLVFWGGLAAVIVALISRTGTRTDASPQPDPRRVLDERFARGDIDEDDYRRRRQVLGERP